MRFTRFRKGTKRSAVGTSPPPGTIVAFASATPPGGWLLCNGSAVSQATYPALYAAIGATLPDLRGKAAMGVGTGAGGGTSGTGVVTGGSALTARSLLGVVGAETVTLSASESGVRGHNHSVSDTSHGHSASDSHTHNVGMAGVNLNPTSGTTYAWPGGALTYASTTTSAGWSNNSTTSGISITDYSGTAASSAHTNTQPSLVVAFIIKT